MRWLRFTAMGSLTDLEVAFEVADQAAALALRYFETGVTSTPTADGSPVTEADLALNVCFASHSGSCALRMRSWVRSADT